MTLSALEQLQDAQTEDKDRPRIIITLEDIAKGCAALINHSPEYDRSALEYLVPIAREVMPRHRLTLSGTDFTRRFESAERLMPPGADMRFLMSKSFPRGNNHLSYSCVVFQYAEDIAQGAPRSWGRTAAIAMTGACLAAWWTLKREKDAEAIARAEAVAEAVALSVAS